MLRILFVAITLCSFNVFAFGQSKRNSPMHIFLEKYVDSAVVIEYQTDTYNPSYYRTITKVGDTINAFLYNSAIELPKVMIPNSLKTSIYMEKLRLRSVEPNIDAYFNLVDIPKASLDNVWQKIQKLNLWNVSVDNSKPKCQKIPVSSHEGTLTIYLITRGEIRKLVFYDAIKYEEYCPGNKNRRPVVELYKLFSKSFNKL